jgi:hypothetical protein
MTYYPDLGKESYSLTGEHIRAVGWLSKDHDFPKAEPDPEFVQALEPFIKYADCCELYFNVGLHMGHHICEFCGGATSYFELLIPSGDLLSAASEIILHYVTEHNYSPPCEFVEAVKLCPAPITREYAEAIRLFSDYPEECDAILHEIQIDLAAKWAHTNGGVAVVEQAASRTPGDYSAEDLDKVRKSLEYLLNPKGFWNSLNRD